mmetsp:Transcript_5280/g.8121  ORF Transcript_5280/g.8121 Transcript_5280/m.8121 type:complete len:257 (+) Transcript_5280:221-991(+)
MTMLKGLGAMGNGLVRCSGLMRSGNLGKAQFRASTIFAQSRLSALSPAIECERIKPVEHLSEKEIKKSGTTYSGGSGCVSGGFSSMAAGVLPQEDVILEPLVQLDVQEELPVMKFWSPEERRNGTAVLAKVFRALADHKIDLELSSAAVSSVSVALLQPLSADTADLLEQDLNNVGVECKVEKGTYSLVKCSTRVFEPNTFKNRMLEMFSERDIANNMLVVSKGEGSHKCSVSAVVPRGQLSTVVQTIEQRREFFR